MPAYRIELSERRTGDGRRVYACSIESTRSGQYCTQGQCGSHFPAYSRELAVEKLRAELQYIRDGGWNRPDDPAPTIGNTALVDETGEFSLPELFDEPTLQTFMQGGDA